MALVDRVDIPVRGVSAGITRRTLFVGGVATLGLALAGCGVLGDGERSDPETVQHELQTAVEALPEYVDGTVQYVDGISSGTTISGVLRVNSTSREQTERALTRIHEALIGTYLTQPSARKAFVRMTVSPLADASATVESADVTPPEEGANTTTDDLAAQFGL